MVQYLEKMQKRRDLLTEQLTNAHLDRNTRSAAQKELSQLAAILDQINHINDLKSRLSETITQASKSNDSEMKELFELEKEDLELSIHQSQKKLDESMISHDEHDDRSVYLEIRSGAGGQEAALFAADLMKMYTAYALKKGWNVSVESESHTDLGGFREVILHIKGQNVYQQLKHESGVHRVQRVPATETQGRVHTSTATIAVLPEAKEVDVQINPADIRVDVFRASGAGGQHVNTTDSAVRLTHIPTNVVVSCQDERSQHKNKAKAMKILQSRILLAQKKKHDAQMSENRKAQVGTGMRSEKVRTYNYPQNRVTDHQIELTLKNLDMVMIGQIDDIIDGLVNKDIEERRKEFLAHFVKEK